MQIRTRDLRIADRDLGFTLGPRTERAPAQPKTELRGGGDRKPVPGPQPGRPRAQGWHRGPAATFRSCGTGGRKPCPCRSA